MSPNNILILEKKLIWKRFTEVQNGDTMSQSSSFNDEEMDSPRGWINLPKVI